jgi:hypothetical protein
MTKLEIAIEAVFDTQVDLENSRKELSELQKEHEGLQALEQERLYALWSQLGGDPTKKGEINLIYNKKHYHLSRYIGVERDRMVLKVIPETRVIS